MHTPTQIDRDIAIRKFSRLRRRAVTALETSRGLASRVRDLNDELRDLNHTGVPQPSAAAVAAVAPPVAGVVRSPAARRSRVAVQWTPPVDGSEWHLDPKRWIETWNAQQDRAAAIVAELGDLEQARDQASAEWHAAGGLLSRCKDFLAANRISVEA
jgi:hypothetical protein